LDFEAKEDPMREEISAILLHQPTESQRLLKQALEGRSIKVNWLQNYREALPLLREADPPHLVFTEALLPDGTWADVVKLALEALKPVKVIVVSRLIDVGLYLKTIDSGAFDFIVPPVTGDDLAHVLAGAVGSVLDLRRTQITEGCRRSQRDSPAASAEMKEGRAKQAAEQPVALSF
jgi:DNA-binding NtrC family response regulator